MIHSVRISACWRVAVLCLALPSIAGGLQNSAGEVLDSWKRQQELLQQAILEKQLSGITYHRTPGGQMSMLWDFPMVAFWVGSSQKDATYVRSRSREHSFCLLRETGGLMIRELNPVESSGSAGQLPFREQLAFLRSSTGAHGCFYFLPVVECGLKDVWLLQEFCEVQSREMGVLREIELNVDSGRLRDALASEKMTVDEGKPAVYTPEAVNILESCAVNGLRRVVFGIGSDGGCRLPVSGRLEFRRNLVDDEGLEIPEEDTGFLVQWEWQRANGVFIPAVFRTLEIDGMEPNFETVRIEAIRVLDRRGLGFSLEDFGLGQGLKGSGQQDQAPVWTFWLVLSLISLLLLAGVVFFFPRRPR